MIIALSGYGGAGKDSVADVLVEEYGFKRFAWADTLRMAASALNPIVGISDQGTLLRYDDVIELVGYNDAKFLYPEVRNLLQRLGTQVGRNLISDTVWIDATMSRIKRECSPGSNIVITDTRFTNEADLIKQQSPSGFVVRVSRAGVGPAGDHISEIELDDYDFDYVLINDGTLEDLKTSVDDLLEFTKDYFRNLR